MRLGFGVRQSVSMKQSVNVGSPSWYVCALSLLLGVNDEEFIEAVKEQFDQDAEYKKGGNGGPRGKALTAEERELLENFYAATKGQPDVVVNGDIITEKCEAYFKIVPLEEDDSTFIPPYRCTFTDIIRVRGKILRRITRWIMLEQAELFAGSEFVIARTRKNCAEALQLDPTTVSRAVKGKRVQVHASNGLKYNYQMPFFFSRSPIHPYTFKKWIQKKLQAEDKKSPISDLGLAQLWNGENSEQIGRRFISKWREENKLPASKDRREE